jgi:hypothetical protein
VAGCFECGYEPLSCEVSGLRHGVVEALAVVGCHVAHLDRFTDVWGQPIFLRNIPEERSTQTLISIKEGVEIVY